MKNKYEPSVFTNEWGAEISSGGYVQIPNDFVRNLGLLRLSANEAMVIIVVISYGKHRPVSANQIADHLGLSVRTVRTAFRKLDGQLKLMHRSYGVGEANTFSFGGLKRLLIEVAKNRQAYRQKDAGVSAILRCNLRKICLPIKKLLKTYIKKRLAVMHSTSKNVTSWLNGSRFRL